jgi:hypothetical protein
VRRLQALALLVAAALLVRPLLLLDGNALQAGAAFAAAAAALLPAAFAWPGSAAPATAATLLLAEYAFALLARGGHGLDPLAPLVGVLLLVLLELLQLTADRRGGVQVERPVRVRQLAWLLGDVAAGLVAASLVLTLAASGGVEDTSVARAVAFTAVAAALAVPVLVARRVVGRERITG